MHSTPQYDYIITGSGCAGLSLALHIINSGKLSGKKILLVDSSLKNKNNRTWCFWEKQDGLFQSIVYKQWECLWFHANDFSKQLSIEPYKYKLIRGIDFYEYCLAQVKQQNNFTVIHGNVESIESNTERTTVTVDGQHFFCAYIFNSIPFQKPQLQKNEYWLLQHFKGWFIKADQPQFDPGVATLMDFRTSQSSGTSFFYTLPFSTTEALIEYTLFSKDLLDDEEYETAITNYIEYQLSINAYSITEKEFGIIPMTNYAFSTGQNNIINIGTVGGRTKGSSGYTFQFIQKHSADLVKSLIENGNPFHTKSISKKFRFYDSVLLNILHNNTLGGAAIFKDLFEKNSPQQVLKFLDNETSLADDLKIISSLPALPFAKAALQHIF